MWWFILGSFFSCWCSDCGHIMGGGASVEHDSNSTRHHHHKESEDGGFDPCSVTHSERKRRVVQAIGRTISGIVNEMSSLVAPEADPVDPSDILFAMKALALCKLSYNTLSQDPEADDLKKKWIEVLKVEQFKCWYDRTDHSSTERPTNGAIAFDAKNQGIEAISGIMHDVSENLLGPTPFVCFRGCMDPAHVVTRHELADIISVHLEDHEPRELLDDNCVFLNKYRNLQKLCTTKHHANADDMNAATVGNDCLLDLCCKRGSEFANGLLVCGHSLGGAMASLFAAEVYSNYGNAIPLHLITLGAPKVFSSKTAAAVNAHPYRNLRFCNNNDMVLSLGAPHHHPTGKNCRMVFADGISSRGEVHDNNAGGSGLGLDEDIMDVDLGLGEEEKEGVSSKNLYQDPKQSQVQRGEDSKKKRKASAERRRPRNSHHWVGVGFQVLRPQQHEPVKKRISEETAVSSHSILGHGGYYDSIFHSCTYQQALDKLYNKDIRESYDLVHELINAERKRFWQ